MTVRGSVGASPSRSLYGDSTVESVCSLWAIAELSELARLARTACGIYAPGFLGASPGMTMIGGRTGVNDGCACGIATMCSLIDLGEHFRLKVDSPYSEREGEAPTEPRTVAPVHRCRMGVADRANRDGDRPVPRERLPGSACPGSLASCPLRSRQHHADTRPA